MSQHIVDSPDFSLSGTFTLGIFLSRPFYFCLSYPGQQFNFTLLTVTHTPFWVSYSWLRRMWSQPLCTQKQFPCRPQRMLLCCFNLFTITVMQSHNLSEAHALSAHHPPSLSMDGIQILPWAAAPCHKRDFSWKKLPSSWKQNESEWHFIFLKKM